MTHATDKEIRSLTHINQLRYLAKQLQEEAGRKNDMGLSMLASYFMDLATEMERDRGRAERRQRDRANYLRPADIEVRNVPYGPVHELFSFIYENDIPLDAHLTVREEYGSWDAVLEWYVFKEGSVGHPELLEEK